MENYVSVLTIKASTRSQLRTAIPCHSSMNYSTIFITPDTSRNAIYVIDIIDSAWLSVKNGKQLSTLTMTSTNTQSCLLVFTTPPVFSNTTLTTFSITTWMTSW